MDEQQLLKECRKQNRQAQEALYQLFAPEMLGVCYRYTKSLDDAEDVLQEGFVKVFTHLQQYRGDGALGGWIRKIMVHASLNYLRQHSRYRNQLRFEVQPLHPVVNEAATPKIATEELIEYIRKLPVGYQTVFNLVGVEGFSHKEVAEMLGISEQTARSQYSRARATLMKWLAETENMERKSMNL